MENSKAPTPTDLKISSYVSKIKIVQDFYLLKSVQPTLLLALFFEEANVKQLHDDIVKTVDEKLRLSTSIGPQSRPDLVVIMYDTFTVYGTQLNESQYDFETLLSQVKREVGRLNNIAKKKAISIILANIKSQDEYRKQRDKNRLSDFQMPLSTSKAGTIQYRDIPF